MKTSHSCPEKKRGCEPKPSMMINEISKLFHDKMRENSEKLGFKNGYRQVLMVLARGDGITQLDIANATHLKAPTVSITLKQMEKEKLVSRVTDEVDMRRTRVYLLDKGRELDNRLREKIKELEEVMLRGIDKEEERKLLSCLGKIRDNIVEDGNTQERNSPSL